MLLYYDLRLNLLVERPGLEAALSSVTFKRGGREPLEVQFGRSPIPSTGLSVQNEASWTAEQLTGTPEIVAGFKAARDYEGTVLAEATAFTWDGTNNWYSADSGGMDLDTAALNAALGNDSAAGNDIPAIDDAMFEVKYRTSGSARWHASREQITAIVYHNVLQTADAVP